MALKLELDSVESLDESTQKMYRQEGDRYLLDVEGLPDTKGLKSALDKERKTAKELAAQLKNFAGVDLEDYQSLQSRRAELDAHDPKAVDELISQRVKKNDEAWQGKFEEVQVKLQEKDNKLGDLLISDELRRVGAELGVKEGEPMSDFVARGKGVFKLKDGQVIPQKNGEVLYGESGVEPLTMREFTKTLSETAEHLFKTSGGGGAANSGDGDTRSGTVQFKSDLKTDAEKAAYIGKHGRNAFLNLPQAPARTG